MKFNFKNKYIHSFIYNEGFSKYTEIQEKIIPIALKGKNVIGISSTGTGKTFSFLLPIIDSLDLEKKEIQSVIILPTRELARQIYTETLKFKKYENKLIAQFIIGGENSSKKIDELSSNVPHVLITTTEKFIEINQRYKKIFNNLKSIIFDEVDMLIDLGFIDSFTKVLNCLNPNVQKLAFSATLHDMVSGRIRNEFKNCEIISVSKNIWKNNNINHYLIHYSSNKEKVLEDLLRSINPYFCIIFANTIKEVELINELLNKMKITHRMIHGKIEARKRKTIFKEIKSNQFQYLVATDIASRGLDIDGASHIISWNLPTDDVWYIHRSGRSGRSKYEGNSYVFFDDRDLRQISRLKNKDITWKNLKYKDGKFINFDYKIREPKKIKNSEIDSKIKTIVNTSSKKVKPNYKKKMNLKIHKIKQKEKRKKIDESVKKALIKKYKIENAKKKRGESYE